MYSSLEKLQSIYGATRLATATPSSPETAGAYWESKLAAASAQIDAVLRQAGYAVPIVFSNLSESDSAAVQAILGEWESVLALEMGAPGIIATEKGVNSAADTARANMKQLLAGRMRLPMPLVRATVGSVSGPDFTNADTVPPNLTDSLFYRNRTGWEG